ncbi:Hpt domain-containing protein [Croceicoccus naphthovorans]|uniref:Uncharacterized protein n=1 Tax=Croceicoccus naphthovorans TaxID=1348774 RepID=A0A0G3XJ86_9SPHN|nr:Hpt domain-containing protein [Croceicoccus naphthovorans]AKM10676.1 hypothetical protein AB433_12990 [Croceicoccus naphthovorans]MBB3988912.1 HPt (histidine-containing phosphotransfer) domain-containing protein [Croceicoccus naphthovorans]
MSDFEGRLAALRARFRDRLIEERDWFGCFAAGGAAADAEAARDRSHKLCGIAGSMGYGAVSDAARALEQVLMDDAARSDVAGRRADLLATLNAALADGTD